MISVRKLLAKLLLISLIFTNTGSYVFAEDAVLHSLDELPSVQVEATDLPVAAQASFSELLAEKSAFESTQYSAEEKTETTESLSIIGSALAKEHEMYVAQAMLAFTPSTTPTLTPTFITSPFVPSGFSTGSVLDTFFGEYNSLQVKKGEKERKEKDSKWKTKKEKKVEGTKGAINAAIVPGTIIKTESGDIISEDTLDISTLPVSKKNQAKKQFETKMKNRGNLKKGKAEASPEGFDFGIPGTHLIFSEPVALTVDMSYATDGVIFDLLTEHAGDTSFHTNGLSVDPTTGCNPDGSATIPGSQAVVKNGQITFYTCGASSFTMNPSGGTTGSNDIRVIVGDCAQVQLYYNNLAQIYTGNPPATGCSTGGNMDAWPVLRIGGTSYGNDFSAWSSSSTVGSTVGNTYTATSTMTRVVGGLTYTLIIDWEHTAPNKYFTWSWRVIIPAGNTQPVKFYYGMDSYIAGNDANDTGYLSSTGGLTLGVYDGVANVLSAFRYISGVPWTAHQVQGYATIRGVIAGGTNFTDFVQTTGGDLGYGVNWDFGTPAATTYSGAIEWRLAPYVSASIVDLVPGIGQPEGPLTTGFVSQMPITLSNVGNLSSSGVHTAVLTIPANITGPASAFTDNGWSCGAQVGTTVTCTKTTSIAPLADETFRIPVIPQPAAGGTSVTFNLAISNASDGDVTNNTAFATNAVVAAAPVLAPGGVVSPRFWAKADGGKNCTTTGCTITNWSNNGSVGAAADAVTGLGTVTYDPATQINYNPTLYFNNASLNTNNTLGMPTRANSIFVVSKIGTGGQFKLGTQLTANNGRSFTTSPTTDQWTRNNRAAFYNGANSRSPDTPAISANIRQTAGASAGYTNGRSVLTSAATNTFVVNNFGIGRVANTNSTLSNVAEVAIYNTALSATQQKQVESYLAIKYGITLDQLLPTDYLLADGTTIWNSGLAGSYTNDIAGIARDDLATLDQRKSQSINNPGDIIVSRASPILSNARGIMWSNDGAGTGSLSTTDAPLGYQRIDREWLFQEKRGDIGTVTIAYPAASLPGGAGGTLYMLVDTDGTFAAGATSYTGTLVSGNWEFTANITDMDIITFATMGDITPPVISGASIASGTLIPHGNFSLTYNYTDVGSGINPGTATGQIYSWNSGTLSYNPIPVGGYMTLGSSNATSATMNIANLPFGRYRFDMSITDNAGNSTTQSFTYFVDRIEWTISADTYNIGNIVQNVATFGTGELIITVRTVGAGFSLTTAPISMLTTPSGSTINYWNGSFGAGYDIWSGAFGGSILTYSPNATLATTVKNINQNGEQNTYTYRVKYGAHVDFMQNAGDYSGTVSFGLTLDY